MHFDICCPRNKWKYQNAIKNIKYDIKIERSYQKF